MIIKGYNTDSLVIKQTVNNSNLITYGLVDTDGDVIAIMECGRFNLAAGKKRFMQWKRKGQYLNGNDVKKMFSVVKKAQ